jgi:hypothetical protein
MNFKSRIDFRTWEIQIKYLELMKRYQGGSKKLDYAWRKTRKNSRKRRKNSQEVLISWLMEDKLKKMI